MHQLPSSVTSQVSAAKEYEYAKLQNRSRPFPLWVAVSQAIDIANFGYAPAGSIPNFLRQAFTTPGGWTLIVVGNGVGFLLAVLKTRGNIEVSVLVS